jgi:uncharacterized protein YhbP (UPF0306 family)
VKRQYIKKNYYFTFGQIHETVDGVPMRDRFVRVRAENEEVAREIFIKEFTSKRMQAEDKFAFSYPENRFDDRFYPLGEYALFEQE